MKFTTAWAKVAAQNVTLKTTVVFLSITTIALGMTSMELALREPPVIERACFTKAVSQASSKAPTESEIHAFLKVALSQRFNSDTEAQGGMLSLEEEHFRNTEQKELSQRKMNQTVVVHTQTAQIDGNRIQVDADRLIRVENVRSAFSFPLILTLSKTTRSESNPYGLVLSKVKILEDEKGGKNDKK